MNKWIVCVVLTALWVQPTAAYVGPGAGLSLLGALWGLLLAIGAAVAYVVAWPLRRAWRARVARRRDEPQP